ncbi:hypothetical protein PLICRDRAFT_174458 [Plicaturopsis crispa FD-325 SS-3]|nr:hypothetical protein PLICRDRAFT_174458 [Plicaturopsis crispa FD-325 SS-3]
MDSDSDSDDADCSETEKVEASSEGHDCACGGKCNCLEFLPHVDEVDEVDRFDEPEPEYCAPAYIQIPLSAEWCASIDVDHDGSNSYPDMVCFPVVYDQESEYDDECFDEYDDETGSYDLTTSLNRVINMMTDEGDCYYDDQTGVIECVENDNTQADDRASGQYDQYEELSYGSEEDWDNS